MLRDKSLYSTLDLRKYIGAEQLGILSETANAKYNDTGWKNYASWGNPSNSTQWAHVIKNEDILVTASLLSVGGQKPQRSATGWSVHSGSIPKIGHGMSMDEQDLMNMREVSKINDVPFVQVMLESLNTKLSNLIGGIHNKLNRFTYEALSTGKLSVSDADGISFELDYRIPTSHKGETDKKWFTSPGAPNAQATPVQDLLDFQKAMSDANVVFDHWEVSKASFDAFLTHPDVIAKTAARVKAFDSKNYILTPAEKMNVLHEMGVLPIRVVDEKSAHEENGVAVIDKPAFVEGTWVLCQLGDIFEMKCANSLYKDRVSFGSIGANTMYSFVENRIAILDTWEERPITNIIDVELWALPVFKNPNNIAIFDTTKGS